MFTRDSVIISNNIKTPLTLISRAVGNILQLTYGQLVQSLFANGEQGFAYDPNDLSTMYQDAAGTIPVTAAGQPVGLFLDKSKGLVLGSEKWIDSNVTFTGGSARISPNVYRIYSPDGTYSGVTIPVALTVGRLYKLTLNIDSITLLGAGISPEGNPITVLTTTGQKSVYFFATTTTLMIKRAATSCDIQISNISVKELSGNHAYQSTSASRPILRKNTVTGANYLEFDGSDDFLQTNSIDFTATDKVSLFVGVRKLSDAARAILSEFSGGGGYGSFRIEAPVGTVGNYNYTSVGSITVAANSALAYTAPNSAVLSGQSNISGDFVVLRVNGSISGQSTADQGTGNYGNYPLYIGRRGGTSLPFTGHIYSLIGVGKLTSDKETVAIEKELAKRVGVTLNV